MKNLLIFATSLVLFASCQKVIDVKLKDSNPKYVIEGNISNSAYQNEIKISRTVNYSEPNVFPAVSNATVIISDDLGNTENLVQSTPGVYKIQTLVGVPGRTYTMQVQVDGQTFTAKSTMPQVTPLDSIDLLPFAFGGGENKNIVPIYKDAGGVKNFYRFVPYKNGVLTTDNFYSDDQFSDGQETRRPYFGPTEYKTGDTIKLWMECIDEPVYLYFFSLDQNTSGQATPANPVSNISNGALGYFNATSVSSKEVIVP